MRRGVAIGVGASMSHLGIDVMNVRYAPINGRRKLHPQDSCGSNLEVQAPNRELPLMAPSSR